ncbi:mitochondrial import inner membrane translocase subunit TIM17-2-like [Canna indica]|uniref:Mitochondrial import inner membrane translocase subunit TIM17-2-like n=1 Tax=Canna indica TaxID=4628 RepID=A0AAQ3JSB4_9LILI|nr:mitochondrial import inner membrane translocase subunit TIM17-2-like [Canna indica]
MGGSVVGALVEMEPIVSIATSVAITMYVQLPLEDKDEAAFAIDNTIKLETADCRGLYNSPKGERLPGGMQAVRMNAPRLAEASQFGAASSLSSIAPWSISARRRIPRTPSSQGPPSMASSRHARMPEQT